MASTYLQKFPVPEQFPEILHDLLREILREQPEDIIEFSYRYFKDKQEDAMDPTRAQNRNYYGRQIEVQREEGHSEVIPPPKYQGAKADPYKSDKITQKEIDEKAKKAEAKPKTYEKHSNSGVSSEKLVEDKSEKAASERRGSEKHDQRVGTPKMDDSKSHKTDQSSKTNKVARSEYYNDLTDQILNMYDDSNDGSPQGTLGDENRRQSASRSQKSAQHKHAIREEDEVLERSRRSRED